MIFKTPIRCAKCSRWTHQPKPAISNEPGRRARLLPICPPCRAFLAAELMRELALVARDAGRACRGYMGKPYTPEKGKG